MNKFFGLLGTLFLLLSGSNAKPIIKRNGTILGNEKISHAYVGDYMTDSDYNNLLKTNDTPIFIDEYYASQYFKNLNSNFGNNVYGTCTYVAIGMLLSFYDTYWDDGFIDDNYDVNSTFTSALPPEADFELPPFDIDSPGISYESRELIDNLAMDEYYNFIDTHSDKYFHLKLLNLSKKYFGSIKFDGSYNSLGMSYYEMIEFLNYYLYDYAKYTADDIKITSCNRPEEEMKTFLRKYVSLGIPVLLRTSDLGGHAFVAYDYDKNTDEIYVHAGLRRETDGTALTHVSLGKIDSLNLWDVTAIEIKESHKHSNNFVSTSGETLCSCNYIHPQDIELISGNYRDTLPTFKWKSLYKEKWISQYNACFELSILNSSKKTLYTNKIKNQKEYTLTQIEWDRLLFNSSEKNYYIYINLYSDSYSYFDEYWSRELFQKPKEYSELPVMKPSEYGFADAYPTDKKTKTEFIQHTASNDFKFETRRYRTGYIQNEYVVMSPKRKGINESFIEYRFETAVTRIDVALSHWRSNSYEQLDSSNGTAVIQQFIGNSWVTTLNLLSTDTALTTNRNNQKYYKVIFSQPTYRMRFYSSTLVENTNNDNRGRICIGDIAFYPSEYSLPLSGYELDYDPDIWNKTYVDRFLFTEYYVKDYTNCYSYAVNAQVNPFTNTMKPMQPGQSVGHILTNDDILNVYSLLELINQDASRLNFDFRPIEKNQKCPEGTYKVALVIDNKYNQGDRYQYDYHWYRQNSDGTWSHKPGLTAVTNLDNSKKIIFDPYYCNRNNGEGLNYNLFVGYFAIKPLNIYYN